jgi:hypothetical protein
MTARTQLVGRLDAALAWIAVHGETSPAVREVQARLLGARAVLDEGRGPTSDERDRLDPGAVAGALSDAEGELATLAYEVGALWRRARSGAAGPRRKRGVSPAPRFFLVGARPVRTEPLPDGGLAMLALDWATGRLERDLSQLDVLAPGGRDVEEVDLAAFSAAIDAIRAERRLPRPALPTPSAAQQRTLDWLPTGDAFRPFRAVVDGDEWAVSVNDWPDEPTVYSLWVNGREAFGFDGWPDGWSRP